MLVGSRGGGAPRVEPSGGPQVGKLGLLEAWAVLVGSRGGGAPRVEPSGGRRLGRGRGARRRDRVMGRCWLEVARRQKKCSGVLETGQVGGMASLQHHTLHTSILVMGLWRSVIFHVIVWDGCVDGDSAG
ncbi:hypothetical protein Shel_12030 [Slackia heliotrinireducens DSM 20476]|uniref:Uncharacterized protein n=1 Tax=Slackia heliotrinireducens (strain ATCC 29202 / DSM 20476 / NCTC 11029 / RHS 1) TaxID=471855 RepID=C7N5P6_SLAHD|nr:hypothetical protein Shel_12030 [Slackia heliotrinireducens DSM 20476]